MFSFKKRNLIKVLKQIEQCGIASDQKRAYQRILILGSLFLVIGLFIGFAGFMQIVTSSFLGLLLGAIGGVMILYAVKSKHSYQAVGATVLMLDPLPPVIGGQLGGWFVLTAKIRSAFTVRLSCLHFCSTASGEGTDGHTDVLHQQVTQAYISLNESNQQTVNFVFSLPENLPESDSNEYRGNICWQLSVEGHICLQNKMFDAFPVDDRVFKRTWKLPVLSRNTLFELGLKPKSSCLSIPQSHIEAVAREHKQQASESAEQQIGIKTDIFGNIKIVSETGRNKGLWRFLMVFGGIFGVIGLYLFYLIFEEGATFWFIAPIVSVLGWCIFGFGLLLVGRKLEARIERGKVHIIRSFWGYSLYQRSAPLQSSTQLSLKMTMSITSQEHIKTEYMAIYADIEGKKITIAEGVKGRMAGEAMLDKIKAAFVS